MSVQLKVEAVKPEAFTYPASAPPLKLDTAVPCVRNHIEVYVVEVLLNLILQSNASRSGEVVVPRALNFTTKSV